MIYLVLFCVAVFLVVLGILLKRALISRDKHTGKLITSFKDTGKILPGKAFWSLIGAVAIIYALSLLIPIVWMLLTSVKDPVDYSENTFGLPSKIHLENFSIVFQKFEIQANGKIFGIVDMLLNSIIYSCGNPLVTLFWVYSMAYVMARFKFWGNTFLFNLGVLIMMITLAGSSASQMIIYKAIGLYDNLYLNIVMPPSTAFSGMYFMIIYGACKSIPQTYSEAAYIDGAGDYNVMWRIIFPMVLPTCFTIYVLTFLGLWNNYESFLVWFPSSPNIAYGLYRMQGENAGSDGLTTPQIIAGMVMVMIPSFILYLCSQKIMKSNFVVGGLKG